MNHPTKISELQLKDLAQALLQLQSEDETIDFLRDIFSAEELERVPKRWQVIYLLLNKKTFREVQEATGASFYMISRANQIVIKQGSGISRVIQDRMQT